MKNFYYATTVALMVTALACKKSSGPSSIPVGQNSQFIRIQQGVSADDDTVYLIKYDDKKRIASLIDSINTDTLLPTYNSSDQLTDITERSTWANDHLTVTYNGSGQPAQIDFSLFGENDRFVFEYSGGMPSKNSFYSDAGQGGSPALWRTYTYTITGSNITGIKEYDKVGTLLGERTITFGTQSNPFKTLALFNWSGRLGADDILPIETVFNANVATATTWYNDNHDPFYTTTVAVTNNAAGSPVGITATEKDPTGATNNLFTWSFYYK
jgi:hypothetical protein